MIWLQFEEGKNRDVVVQCINFSSLHVQVKVTNWRHWFWSLSTRNLYFTWIIIDDHLQKASRGRVTAVAVEAGGGTEERAKVRENGTKFWLIRCILDARTHRFVLMCTSVPIRNFNVSEILITKTFLFLTGRPPIHFRSVYPPSFCHKQSTPLH